MIDDMRMRMHKLEEKTCTAYVRAVNKLAFFLKRSPDTATVEDLRRFQLYMVDQGTSPITINATISGLRFFFDVTVDRRELMAKMQTVQVPQQLPVVLSREEVARLIAAAPNLKSQTALSVAYATGLRVSEVVALKVTDIDSKRMTLRVIDVAPAKRRCPGPRRTQTSVVGGSPVVPIPGTNPARFGSNLAEQVAAKAKSEAAYPESG